nr:peptidase domain-containing ABC transporter [Clostridium paraputrificum]
MKQNIRINVQLDSKDCGPACISSLIKYYGKNVSIARIRQIANTDLLGTSGRGMIKSLKHFGFNTKGIRIKNLEELRKYEFPIIAHVRSNKIMEHYVLVYEIENDRLLIGDPLKGVETVKIEDFFEISTNLFLLAVPNDKFVEIKSSRGVFKELAPLFKPYKKNFLIILILTLLSSFLGIINSFYFKFIIDNIMSKNIKLLASISIVFLFLVVISSVNDYIRQKTIVTLAKNLDISILTTLYKKLINLPISYFKLRKIGEISSRIDDAIALRDVMTTTIISVFMDIIMIVSGSLVLIKINYTLFFSTIIPISLYIVTIFVFGKIINIMTKNVLEESAKTKAKFIEILNGITLIKSFTLEKVKEKEMRNATISTSETSVKLSKIISLQLTIQQFIKNVYTIILLWIGIMLVYKNKLTLGYLFTFNSLLAYFISPIERLVKMQPKIQNVALVSERLLDILDTDGECENDGECIDENLALKKLSEDIVIKDVRFRYGERDLILKDISLKLESKKIIGIVGASGSGKTTIANILLRFFEVESGEVLFGGVPIYNISRNVLRENIGYVSQETILFNMSIKDNLFSDDIKEIDYMCDALGLSNFIKSLPMGYDTILEENGSNLSGGQRQKLSIIRALLKKPKILILDEATSNLDTISEANLDKLISSKLNITIIKIAHRLTTVEKCEKIYVIDKGKVVEVGNHNELIRNGGKYSELWNQQYYEVML